jgi:hypothetical protein
MKRLACVMVVVLAACGSSGSGSGGNSAATTPTSAAASSRTQRELPPRGPADPAYMLLAAGHCQRLLDMTKSWGPGFAAQEGVSTAPLYTSAANACLGRWSDAQRAFKKINVNAPNFATAGACARAAVLQWMVGLLDQRNQDSSFAPKFVPSPARSTCA